MATIIHKKSSVPGKVPLVGDLTPGELAINTADGILYAKKDDNTIISVGGGSGKKDFIASGAVASGEVVGLRSDGTVESISSTGTTSYHATENFEFSNQSNRMLTTYDIFNKRLIQLYTKTNFTTVVKLGIVENVNITYGEEIPFLSGDISISDIIYDLYEHKIGIMYVDNDDGQKGKIVIGNVSGDNITFGTPVIFNNIATEGIKSTYDNNNNNIIISFENANGAYAIAGTVIGLGITLGTAVLYSTENFNTTPIIIFDSYRNTIHVMGSYYISSTSYIYNYPITNNNMVLTSQGSFGNFPEYGSLHGLSYDSTNNRIIVIFISKAVTTNNYSRVLAAAGDYTGDSLNYGTPLTTYGNTSYSRAAVFDTSVNKTLLTYTGITNVYGRFRVLSTSSSSLWIGTSAEIIFYVSRSAYGKNVHIPDQGSNVNSNLDIDKYEGQSYIVKLNYLNTNVESSIGIAATDILDSESGGIDIFSGINDQQVGLTPGVEYYADYAGNITDNPDNEHPNIYIGKSISSNKIIVGIK